MQDEFYSLAEVCDARDDDLYCSADNIIILRKSSLGKPRMAKKDYAVFIAFIAVMALRKTVPIFSTGCVRMASFTATNS